MKKKELEQALNEIIEILGMGTEDAKKFLDCPSFTDQEINSYMKGYVRGKAKKLLQEVRELK